MQPVVSSPKQPCMKKYNIILYTLAVLKLALPYFIQNSFYDPHRDEFLYLAEGHHLAWGYMEIPPLLSVFAWLTHLLGDGMFWIKFWPSLFGALTFVVAGKLVLHLGGMAFALFMCWLPFIYSGYLRMHFLFQPNFLEMFFWLMIGYSITRYIQTQKNYYLYLTGISAGLGMMSKYSVLFYITAVLAGLALTKQRKIFTNKHLYISAVIGFIIFLPNVLWQYNRHFPVLHHMQELTDTQLQYVNPVNFLIGQLVMFAPCIFVWLAGLWFTGFSNAGKPYRFAAWAYIFIIIIMVVLHGKDYYAFGAYPILIAFGAYQLERATALRFKWLRYVMGAVPFLFTVSIVPVVLPVFKPARLAEFYEKSGTAKKLGALRWEDQQDHPLPQDFSDMLGWDEMAKKTAAVWHSLTPEEQKRTFVFCDTYGQAGAVSFYAQKYGMPEAYSANASFLYWMPDSVRVENLLLVTDDENEMQHPFVKDFVSAQVKDSVTTEYARDKRDLIIYFKGANDAFNQMFKKKLADARGVFVK